MRFALLSAPHTSPRVAVLDIFVRCCVSFLFGTLHFDCPNSELRPTPVLNIMCTYYFARLCRKRKVRTISIAKAPHFLLIMRLLLIERFGDYFYTVSFYLGAEPWLCDEHNALPMLTMSFPGGGPDSFVFRCFFSIGRFVSSFGFCHTFCK